MLELASAFGVFANGGEKVHPVFIKKIVTLKGEVLEENPYLEPEETEEEEQTEESPSSPLKERVTSPQNAFIMTHLLEGVVQHGTGQRARALGRPVAGKTGTSSDYADAWFIGYTPSLLSVVWVGFDDKTSLGKNETGARAALPIWISFMERALRDTPVEDFKAPEGITFVKVDIESGLPVISGSSSHTVQEAFVDGTQPPKKEGQTKEESSPGTPVRGKSPQDPPAPSGRQYKWPTAGRD